MKKHISLLLISGMILLLATSCLEKYLDKAPEQGLTDEIVFTKYANFRLFFDAVYNGQKYYSGSWRDSYNIKCASPIYFDFWDQKYTTEGVTDCADQGRYMEGHAWKSGNMSETIVNKMTYDGARRPILESMFMDIRIANIAIRNVDRIQDADADTKNDFLGQAYFVRALCHFTLFRYWGPMPYLDMVIGPGDQWDIPRLTANAMLNRCAGDLDSSYYFFKLAKKVRRDPAPGFTGHNDYTAYEMYRPSGISALGLKSRVLLYAASPLNNANGVADWQKAAQASWDAIKTATDPAVGVTLLTPLSARVANYVGAAVCDESLWTWSAGSLGWNSGNFAAWFCGQFGNSASSWSGVCPTQNWVDRYETSFGEPLLTQADRDAASLIVTGGIKHYVEQDPYANRDPRLATDVVTNQSSATGWTSGKAQIWYNTSSNYGELLNPGFLGRTFTGYLMRKHWGDASQSASQKKQNSYIYADPLIRLAEMYLNYAEASNEAYGPKVIGVSGATLTAEGAINLIRSRASMPAVKAIYTTSTDVFRPRIKNERNIELSFEGHYYHDIRRWKDLQTAMQSILYGVNIQKVTTSSTYPTGYSYVRQPLSFDRQPVWKWQMYYLPFNNSDFLKMKNFVPNPVW